MPEIIKDREKKASYLTVSSTERALYTTAWFIISEVFLSKITRGQNGCREQEKNQRGCSLLLLVQEWSSIRKAVRAWIFSMCVSTGQTNTL